MRKVLIVGGAGYIGGYMVDYLGQSNAYEVTVFDNLLYETRYLKNVRFIFGDIRDRKKLGAIINDYDTIIWLAAIVGDGACAVDPALTREVNFESVKWLVDTYKNGPIVFMSTCSVYGINSNVLDESAEPAPLSEYAKTKLEAERYVMEHCDDYLIFRLGTLFGFSDTHSRPRLDLVVNVLTARAVQGLPLKVFGGQQWRPILHVRDATHAVDYCLTRGIRGMYNLSERNVEISELAHEIKYQMPEVNIEYQDMKFEDLRDYRVKSDRIRATGWIPSPQCTLTHGVAEMRKIFSEGRMKDFTNPVYSNEAYIRSLKSLEG